MKKIVNIPYKSRWIGGMYIFFTVLIALLYLIIYFTNLYSGSCSSQIVFSVIMLFVFSLISITTIGFYTTKYKIMDGVLSSRSPFTFINLKIKNIKKVERIMVPLHFSVGASLYCGIFYVPNLGWVRSIITNLRDAVLITTKDGKYFMITPSRPERFMKMLKG